jgi:hypothetical protein
MGVLFDYFAAPSDESAVATIDRVAGPGVPTAPAPQLVEKRQGLSRIAKTVAAPPDQTPGPAEPVYDTVEVKGIDPVVMISTLEAILTGVSYEEIIAGPRAGQVLDDRDGGERLIVALSDEIQEALASADQETIDRVVPEWLRTEEFGMTAGWSVPDVARIVGDLAGLARRAKERGDKLYCWVCV